MDSFKGEYSLEQCMHMLLSMTNDIKAHIDTLTRLQRYNEWLKVLNSYKEKKLLHSGYKVYSMNDQDGIIEKIFDIIGTKNKFFIEFGCNNGLQNNCRYLLSMKGWKGIWLEGDEGAYNELQQNFKEYIEKGKLDTFLKFITRENIDQVLIDSIKKVDYSNIDNPYEPDLLVIDIDWNDYYVWDAIKSISPRVVCIEYNSHIPSHLDLIVPYCVQGNPWNGSSYFGASLGALNKLAIEKGYKLIGCSVAGTDAFFVKNEIIRDESNGRKFFEEFLYCKDIDFYYEPPRFNLEYNLGHDKESKDIGWCEV